MFFETQTKKCLRFSLDQDNLFKNKLNSNYEKLVENLKQIHGLGEESVLMFNKGVIKLNTKKANALLGKWAPNRIKGVEGEIGTDDVINNLAIFRNYAFADKSKAIRAGSIQMLKSLSRILCF